MKKLLLVAFAVMAITITGCGTDNSGGETPQDVQEQINEALEYIGWWADGDSRASTPPLEGEYKVAGVEVSINWDDPVDADGTILLDALNNKIHGIGSSHVSTTDKIQGIVNSIIEGVNTNSQPPQCEADGVFKISENGVYQDAPNELVYNEIYSFSYLVGGSRVDTHWSLKDTNGVEVDSGEGNVFSFQVNGNVGEQYTLYTVCHNTKFTIVSNNSGSGGGNSNP